MPGHLFEAIYVWNPTFPHHNSKVFVFKVGHTNWTSKSLFCYYGSQMVQFCCLDSVICWPSTQSYRSQPQQLFLFILRFCIWVKYESCKLFPLGQYKWLIPINGVRFQNMAFSRHFLFDFWFLRTLKKSYKKIVKIATFCKKIFLHLGLPKPNANSGHGFFNRFWLVETLLNCKKRFGVRKLENQLSRAVSR